jgi:hypothetical protein
VAFIPTDIFPTLSRSPGDGGVRTVREETPPKSVGGRNGFSSVLRTARGVAGMSTIREADGARPVNQTDDGTHAKETKGFNDSTGLERSHASLQTTERARTSSKDDKCAGETRACGESSPQQNDGGADPQDQGPVPIAGLISAQAQSQAVDQAEVQTETEPRLIDDEAGLERESQHLSIFHKAFESFKTTPEATRGRSSMNSAGAAVHLPSTQPSNPAEPQANDDESGVQDAGPRTEEVVKDSGRVASDRGGSVSVSQDSTSSVLRSPQDQNSPLQVVQAHVGKTSSDGKDIVANDKASNDEGRLVEYSLSSQVARPVQSLGDQDALGASTEQSSSHGRQPGNDGPEQFSEPWSRHNGRQMETAGPTISQPFVVDHTIANGSVALGASSQASSAPGTPASTPVVTQVQPGLPREEMAQPTGVPGTRSVVVNVAQPDLGHVNIRVAMTNAVVHTFLSSDRADVGQFFINGQDRLQAALQASGLDLGQFRVDIDRQSSGRSFQQGSSQEQGQLWNQGSHGIGQELHSEQHGQTRGTLHGLLNVVA